MLLDTTSPQQSTTAAEPSRPKRPVSVTRSIALCGCFAIGLFATAALIRPKLPFQPVPTIQEKLAWLKKHGDEYDTIFIGSSRTNHHIIPEEFDRLMAAAGMPTHSFNLGVDGMRAPEDSFVLQAALAKRKAPLKLVIVECNKIAVHSGDDAGIRGTLRIAYWHDLPRSFAVLEAMFARERVNRRRRWRSYRKIAAEVWGPFWYDLDLFMQQAANLGRGNDWLKDQLGTAAPLSPQELGPKNDGYPTLPQIPISDSEWNIIQNQVADFMKKQVRPDFGDRPSQAELQFKRRLVEAHGGRMILVIPPLTGGFEFNPDPKYGPAIPVLDFADPRRYPDLFARPNRQDSGHLNEKGAEIFTRMLVEHLSAPDGPLKQSGTSAH